MCLFWPTAAVPISANTVGGGWLVSFVLFFLKSFAWRKKKTEIQSLERMSHSVKLSSAASTWYAGQGGGAGGGAWDHGGRGLLLLLLLLLSHGRFISDAQQTENSRPVIAIVFIFIFFPFLFQRFYLPPVTSVLIQIWFFFQIKSNSRYLDAAIARPWKETAHHETKTNEGSFEKEKTEEKKRSLTHPGAGSKRRSQSAE